MGNQLASTKPVASPSDYALHELPNNVVYKDTLGSGRFLKTLECFHDEGLVVVKMYFKRGELSNVKEHERLLEIRKLLSGVEESHVWPFQRWLETDKAAYLLRQYFFSNLHDRLSTRPFLSLMEKKWLAFQLLKAMEQSHDKDVCHGNLSFHPTNFTNMAGLPTEKIERKDGIGDIKCENVMVTSWNWLYLTDYASFKPTYLPADNPADFSFFFDTGGRRRCYLAPERFFDPGDSHSIVVNATLAPAMDVFSVGCVIAELFLEGHALFDLSTLLAYRNGNFDPWPLLGKIPDVGIRDMVAHMVQLEPNMRLSAKGYLKTWASRVFPSYFYPFLHNFFAGLIPMDTDARVIKTLEEFDEIHDQMLVDALKETNKSLSEKLEKEKPHSNSSKHLHIRSVPSSTDENNGNNSEKGSGNEVVKKQQNNVLIDGQNDLFTDIKKLLEETERLRPGGSIMAGPFPSMINTSGSIGRKSRNDNNSSGDGLVSSYDRKQGGGETGYSSSLLFDETQKPPLFHDVLNYKTEGATRPKTMATALAEIPSDVEEVVTEEVFENQVREVGGSFNARFSEGGDSEDIWITQGLSRRKEDINLPTDGGWRWDGDWEVDLTGGPGDTGADKNGWRYRTTSTKEDSNDIDEIARIRQGGGTDRLDNRSGEIRERHQSGQLLAPGRGWSNFCKPNSIWRQRRWIRKRRRKPPCPTIVPGPGDLGCPINSPTSTRSRARKTCLLWAGRAAGRVEKEEEMELEVRCEGMVLIAGLLCTCLRNMKLPQSRRTCVELLRDSALHCDDDTRLQRVIPFVVSLLSDNRDPSNLDSPAVVKCAALYALADVLAMVRVFPATDAKIFPEYIFPSLSLLPQHSEESVRTAYADNICKFAETAHRFLMYSSHMSVACQTEETAKKPTGEASHPSYLSATGDSGSTRGEGGGLQPNQHSRYDVELNHIREAVKVVVEELVTGPRSTPAVRRALLLHMADLCRFFGRKYSNDFLLPLLITFLNDRDNQVRAAFFEHVAQVCVFVGRTSLEAFLLPCIEQALNDVVEAVIVSALGCLTSLCVREQLRKRVLVGSAERTAPLLCHPSAWVRRAAVAFTAAAGSSLSPADAHSLLSPVLAPLLRREPTSLSSEAAILACLKPPVSREFFNLELTNALQSISGTNKMVREQNYREKQPSSTFRQVRLNGSSASDLVASPLYSSRDHSNSSKQLLPSSSKRSTVDPVFPNSSGDTSDREDGEKMRALQSYIRNSSSVIHSQRKQWEAEGFDKLKGPGSILRTPTGLGTGQGLGNFGGGQDLPAVGIPVYSLFLPDKRMEDSSSSDNEGLQETEQKVSKMSDSFASTEWNKTLSIRRPGFGIGSNFPGDSRGPVINLFAPATGHSLLPSASQQLQRSIALAGSPSPHNTGGSSRYTGVWEDAAWTLSPTATLSGSAIGGMISTAPTRVKIVGTSQIGSGIPPSGAEVGSNDGLYRDPVTKLVGISSVMGGSTDYSWRPKGVLVAHLQEHQKAVNQLAVSPCNSFLASASDDGTVRIWDCRRLERDVSFRNRLKYGGLEGKALCVTMLDGNVVAASSSSGSVHLFHVDYIARTDTVPERYTGISDIYKIDEGEGPVLSLQNIVGEGQAHLLFSSLRGGMHFWDTRIQKESWVLKQPASYGHICGTALHPGAYWVVSATSRGVLTLWDLRFRLPVYTWHHPAGGRIDAIAALLPGVGALSGPASFPPPYARPLVYISAGREEVGLWNAENGTCHQVLRITSLTAASERAALSEVPSSLMPVRPGFALPANSKQSNGGKNRWGLENLGIEELNSPSARPRGMRALLPIVGGATLITGGTDCRIRLWDRVRPDKSHWICGPTLPGEPPLYDSRLISSVRVLQELPCPTATLKTGGNASGGKSQLRNGADPLLASAATDGGGCHRDAILALASVQVSQRLLISSSRDGAIKVWK